MAKTISRLLNNTVPKPDRILNKALKTYRLLIALQLADVARVCFTIGYYPRLRRVMIIFILYKKGKADYLFPGSYRPIALENTLSKILKRVIADCMADTAKKYTLLPQSQMGARKNHLTLSVFILLTATIKSAQAMRRDFIILILSLDISSIYNNIPYKCFFIYLQGKRLLKIDYIIYLRVYKLKRNITGLQ